MEMIYPQKGMRVFVPRDFGGRRSAVVFELVHRNSSAEVYWHIDDRYVGDTRYIHQIEVDIPEGKHVLTVVDDEGNTLRQVFQVVGE